MAQKRFYGVKNHPEEAKNGIYDSWEACSDVVKGAKGVQYKGFGSREEAEQFCGLGAEKVRQDPVPGPDAVDKMRVRQEPSSRVTFDVTKAIECLDYLRGVGIMSDQAYGEMSAAVKDRGVPDPTRMRLDDGITMYVDGSYNERNNQCGFGVYIQGLRGAGHEAVIYGSVPMENGGRNIEGEVTAAWVGLEQLKKAGVSGRPITVYHDYEGVGKWADRAWRANKDYTSAYADLVDAMRWNGMDVSFVHVTGHTGVEGNEMVDRLAKLGCGVHFPDEAGFRSSIQHLPGGQKPMVLSQPVHEDGKSAQRSLFDGPDAEFGVY